MSRRYILQLAYSQVFQGRETLENSLRQGDEFVLWQPPVGVEGRQRAEQRRNVR